MGLIRKALVAALATTLLLLSQAAVSVAGLHSRAWCRVSASYNSRYHNYDVYVHSNRDHHYVWVKDSHGDEADYYTNGSGYADIYLYVHGDPNGQKVTAHVASASCSTTLS
jgi:hypothetical protein